MLALIWITEACALSAWVWLKPFRSQPYPTSHAQPSCPSIAPLIVLNRVAITLQDKKKLLSAVVLRPVPEELIGGIVEG